MTLFWLSLSSACWNVSSDGMVSPSSKHSWKLVMNWCSCKTLANTQAGSFMPGIRLSVGRVYTWNKTNHQMHMTQYDTIYMHIWCVIQTTCGVINPYSIQFALNKLSMYLPTYIIIYIILYIRCFLICMVTIIH